jgi:hypothetical protein
LCGAAKSTRIGTYSDEPFTIRDIQFDNPQVGIAGTAPAQILTEFKWIFSVLGFGSGPNAAALGIGNPLKQPRICALFGQNDQDRPGLALAFVKDGREPACSLNRADQARRFEVGGEPRDYAASFSIEFDSSA